MAEALKVNAFKIACPEISTPLLLDLAVFSRRRVLNALITGPVFSIKFVVSLSKTTTRKVFLSPCIEDSFP